MNDQQARRKGKRAAAWALMAAGWLASGTALAELQWVECQVEATGVGKDDIRGILLSHKSANPLFVSKWYRARDNAEEDMMALAVWAMSTNGGVSVQLDPFAAEWSPIEKFYIKR